MFASQFSFPPIRTYQRAVERIDMIKPIRGKPELRPLDKRSKVYVNIRKVNEAVICQMYATDVVTFLPDKIVVRFNGWNTQSTCLFISQVLGVYVGLMHGMVCLSTERGDFVLDLSKPNVLVYENDVLVLQNPEPVTYHTINRREANNVRRKYKPFRDYMRRVMLIRDAGFSYEEINKEWGEETLIPKLPLLYRLNRRKQWLPKKEDVVSFLNLAASDKLEDQYKASLALVYNLTSNTCLIAKLNEVMFMRPNPEDVMKLLDLAVLYANRDVCFDKRTAPLGVVRSDNYAALMQRYTL